MSRTGKRKRSTRAKTSAPRSKSSAPRRRRPWGRYLIGAALVGLLAATGLYLWIDQRVANRLNSRTAGQSPGLYSDSFRVTRSSPLRPASLREQLLKRRYQESASTPQHAGEFRSEDSSIEFVTREFWSADYVLHPSQRVRVSEQGKFEVVGYPDQPFFELEPVVIATLGSGDVRASNYRRLADIPQHIKDAVLAIEDQRFYQHFGLDLEGLFRAVVANIRAGAFVQGGSTITQQLAKNLVLSRARTLKRKFLEVFAAVSIERHLSKDEILERYLNEVYLGQEGSVSVHGVAEATSTFFDKKLSEISLSEAALLAAIIKGPSYYSPRRHLKRALTRRDVVLAKMAELGMISEAQRQEARKARIVIAREGRHRRSAPYFVAAVKQRLDSELDLDAGQLSGLTIDTGLSPDLQACAESAVREGLAALEKEAPALTRRKEPLEVGLVALEPYSGKIRAWVGGREYSRNQFNHVHQARRQIGSTIKPFLYLTALDPSLNTYKAATPTSILSDEPMQLQVNVNTTWEPENFDREYRGDVTLRYALENSLNMPAIYVAQRVGFTTLADTLRSFRLAPQVQAVPALALGALDTTLLDLTAAYAALANGGIYVEPRLFLSARDSEGEIVSAPPIAERRVANEAPVYVLTNILQGVIERGTGASIRRLGFQGTAAGKTGTSDEARDAWFVGFTPTLATGVWVGFDNDGKSGLTGGRGAAPLWARFMKCASAYLPDEKFVAPPGVQFVEIDAESGELASPQCPRERVIGEVFVNGTEPRGYCRIHSRYLGDSERERLIEPPEPDRRRRRSIWDMLFG